MKDYRFYLEHASPTNKRKNIHTGNVIAVSFTSGRHDEYADGNYSYECISAVYDHPNSLVAGSSVSINYLNKRCKRISEQHARDIHPKLFAYLDTNPQRLTIQQARQALANGANLSLTLGEP